jgi:hypothetical protein
MAATYNDLEDLQVAFKTHACHLRLEFTGEAYINVMITNRGDSPFAILRSNESGGIWRVCSPRTGEAVCEGTAAGVAQYLARPEAGLISQR